MGIIHLIFPKHCPFCDEVIEPFSEVCKECEVRSYELLDNSIDDYFHFAFDDVISVYEYKDIVRDGIKRFKFNSLKENGKFFAGKIAELVKLHYDQNIDYVIAVPMSNENKKLRGYNQAEVLAKHIAKKINVPFADNALKKVKANQIQHKLAKAERQQNVKGVFEFSENIDIEGKTILLVDDIITTGATLDECSCVLKLAGVTHVYCATIAKTLLEDC